MKKNLNKVRVFLDGRDTVIDKEFFENIFNNTEIASKVERNKDRYAFFLEGSLVEARVDHSNNDIQFIFHDGFESRREENEKYAKKLINAYLNSVSIDFDWEFGANTPHHGFTLTFYWKQSTKVK